MKLRKTLGVLLAGLASLAWAEGEEGEGQETGEQLVGERATVNWAGGSGKWTDSKWSGLPEGMSYPDTEYVDVIIDGTESLNSSVERYLTGSQSVTNGNLRVGAFSVVSLYLSAKNTNGHNWYVSSITNDGKIIVSSSSNGNNQDLYLRALKAPSFFSSTSVLEAGSGRQDSEHGIEVVTDGSKNEGLVKIAVSGGNKSISGFFRTVGDGRFINDGLMTVTNTSTYASSSASNGYIGFSGNCELTGCGRILLSNEGRSASCNNVNAAVLGGGYLKTFRHGEGHTIEGSGLVSSMLIDNHGVIKATGENCDLRIRLPYYKTGRNIATNNVSGRLISESQRGLILSGESGDSHNVRFTNLGRVEARTAGVVIFGSTVNTTSTQSDGNSLNSPENQRLELWGKVAGGGEIRSDRIIIIGDGAVLMPGDTVSDAVDAASTCGTLTFKRLVLRAPAAIEGSEETTSGAITEFQCRKPEAGKYDSVWVNGDATVAGTLSFLEAPGSGTYPLFTSTGTLTCDLKALKIACAQGVKAPKLKLVDSTYPVVEEVGVVDEEGNPVTDAETGLPVTETKTVDYPCQVLEATWLNGFTITVR